MIGEIIELFISFTMGAIFGVSIHYLYGHKDD